MTPAIANIQSIILTLATILGSGALVAFVAAHYFGHTRNERRWIFRGVTILTIIIAVIVLQVLLRSKASL